jgi:nitroimidazol reductase NimA-like FMN-containing flavoprotein (pyridoxamine 5'-phosphate oxidase superfamily)
VTLSAPISDLNPNFSSPGATASPWPDAEQQLKNAEVFWISTVRPEGRPHVVPLIAVWLDGALYFTTGEGERKAKNLANNAHVTITTGCNALSEGLDIVVEGQAVVVVSDDAKL